jgi:hypothetical protein
MTDDRTAPEPDDAQAQPTAPLPAAQPTAPLPAPPQAWPSPSAPAPGTAQPAWGSPAGPVGDPGAPEWARPAAAQPDGAQPAGPYGAPPAGPAYGTPPVGPAYGTPPVGPAYGAPAGGYPYGAAPTGGYPYGGAQPAYGTPPGGRRGPSTGVVIAVAVAVVVAVGAVLAGVAATFATSGDDREASAPVVPAPSFGPPSGGATGDPAPGLSPRATPAPAPRVPSPTSEAALAYVAKANAYCRTTTDPALKAAEPLSQTDPARYLRAAAKANRELDAELRKDVPRDLRSTVAQITKNWDALSEGYEKAAEAFEAGDAATFSQLLAQAQDANAVGNDLAQQIGMGDCADAGGLGGTNGGSSPTAPGVTA